MATVVEHGALATREEQSQELAITTQQAMARHEIEGAIVVAQRFPRNEDSAFGRVMRSCERWNFAAMAKYSYPRGGSQVEGASVNLAREIARCWGNLRYGADIVHDDEESRTIRGWAWDVQTNTKETQDATFRKLVQRKQKNGTTQWVKPDERDLLERTNSIAARCVRNCILHLVPPDLVDDAMTACKATIEKDAAKDPDEARKKLIRAFQGLGVPVEELERYLGHGLKTASPKEITDLRGVWKSISDGNSTWADYAKAIDPQPQPQQTQPTKGGASIDDLAKPQTPTAQKPTQTHQDAPQEALDPLAIVKSKIDNCPAASALNNLANALVGERDAGLYDDMQWQQVEAWLAERRKALSPKGERSKGGKQLIE